MTVSGRHWVTLGLLVAVEFVVFLDIAVVNIALPSVGADIGLGPVGAAWVVAAYQLVFGSVLLFGGRLGDAAGHRPVYLSGLAIFTAASLLATVADHAAILIGARAVQGLGAAAVVPSALAMLQGVFADTPEYNRAFGIWVAMRSSGALSGLLVGGVLTEVLGWRWIFGLNVPLGIAVLALGWRLLPRAPRSGMHLDIWGALLCTGGLLLCTVAVGEGTGHGGDADAAVPVHIRLAMLAAGLVALAGFARVERRTANPLLPPRLLRSPTIAGAVVASFLIGLAHMALFYFLSRYLQLVLGYSPLRAALAVLPIAVPAIPVSMLLVPRVLDRLGARDGLLGGLALITVALLWLARIPDNGRYLVDVAPAGLLLAVGLPIAFVGVTAPTLTTAAEADRGVASALVNTVQRIGGGIGVALLTAVGGGVAGVEAGSVSATLTTARSAWLGSAVATLIAFVVAAAVVPRHRATATMPTAENLTAPTSAPTSAPDAAQGDLPDAAQGDGPTATPAARTAPAADGERTVPSHDRSPR